MTPGRLREAAIRGSLRAYALLLHRYPAALRRRFGQEMVETFDAMLREGLETDGARGALRAWRRALADLGRPVPGPVAPDHERGEGTMTGGDGTWGGMVEDLGAAFRSLRREPRFSLLMVAVLGFGLALETSVLSVVNAYLLRGLPFPAAERIVQVRNAPGVSWTEVDHLFERAVSWDLDIFTIIGDGTPEAVRGSWITPDFLDVYAVRPALGRVFRPEEAAEGAAPVAMISHDLWQRRFGGDPDVVGRSFQAFTSDRPDHAESFEIVGVLPADFWYVNRFTGVLAPIRVDRQVYVGRLRPDVTRLQAQAALGEMAAGRMESVPEDYAAELVPLQESYVQGVRPTLVVLQVAVLLVLSIAVANALVLLLVRCARREREFGVRRALGARGGRVARQLLCEGGLLAGVAAAVGMVGASLATGAFSDAVQTRLGASAPGGSAALGLDATVVLLTLATAAGIGILFGGVPWLFARGIEGGSLLRGRGGGDTRTRARLRSLMVVGEVALSMALLAGAGLMVRSALNLQAAELGFEPEQVTIGDLGLRRSSYPDRPDRVALFSGIVDGVRRLPGVEAAGLVGGAPFGGFYNPSPVEGGDAAGNPVGRAAVILNSAGAGYFETMGIELLRGRGFGPGDVEGSEPVALVSASLAERLWPDGGAVGGGLRSVPEQVGTVQEPGDWVRVVGVVSDAEYDMRAEDDGQVYTPWRQTAGFWLDLVVRARPGAPPVTPGIVSVIETLDPEVPFSEAAVLAELVDEAMAPTRFTASVLVAFSAFAVLLAVLGLYGVVAYAARQRRRDVAIRMALGADAGSVTGLFVRQGIVVVAVGVAAGLVGGLALGRSLSGQLRGVAADDPLTHGTVAAALLVTALVAVWLPARRAARSDPMGVLREE